MAPAVGDCFLLDPAGGTNHHLWVVIHFERNWPEQMTQSYVMVSLSSKPTDQCCILTNADHAWLAHDSYARYDQIRHFDGTAMERHLVTRPYCRVKPPRVAPHVLDRLLRGDQASKLTKPKYKAVLPKAFVPLNG